MTDRTGVEPVALWLAWVHPAWMLATLALLLLTLRRGLRLRAARRRGARAPAAAYAAHLGVARLAVAMAAVGFGLGLASAVFLRGFEPLHSAHGLISLVALSLLGATAFLGRGLERGDLRHRELHGVLGMLLALAAAAAFGTGLVLLP